jgi:hypothetical protein
MLVILDFKESRRKRLPIFMSEADHAFQTSFEIADATFPASVIGSRTGATMMHPCVIAGA